MKDNWEMVIGLEVHAQIITNSKLFSGSSTKFGAEPNSQVSFLDAAMPGMLPVINMQAVKQVIKTGLGINAKINLESIFDRKNYFYADLPQGYQISQFKNPIIGEGEISITKSNGEKKVINIERIHIEQDAGKSLHEHSPTNSFIDLNRAGIGLMEIVSKPDMTSSEEAVEYVKKLRSILRYLGTCDGDMEKGSLRCDANVSVRKKGAPLGTRCEIKNLNSFKFIAKAIEYEAARQIEILEEGGQIIQETRLWDTSNNETRTMRTKEDAFDYRYFPDPDLLPLKISNEMIEEIRHNLPELPDLKKERYINNMNLSEYDADILTSDKIVAEYFEEVARNSEPKMAANWIISELFGKLNKMEIDIENSPVSSTNLSKLINLINDGTISSKIAKQVFEEMFSESLEPEIIIKKHGLVQITDRKIIEDMAKQIISENPEKVEAYKSGKDKLFGFFVGQIMKISGGKASPEIINVILKEKLK